MRLVPKSVPQQAIKNCGAAFQRFFKKQGRYPKFKKKGVRDSARLDNGPGTFEFDGQRVRLPVIGWVKLREELRFSGKALSTTVNRVADRWFLSVPVEVDLPEAVRESQAGVGIDLGVSTAATLSSGKKLPGPKPLQAHLERLQRLSRWHSRKKKGSNNRRKSAMRLARLHARISNVRPVKRVALPGEPPSLSSYRKLNPAPRPTSPLQKGRPSNTATRLRPHQNARAWTTVVLLHAAQGANLRRDGPIGETCGAALLLHGFAAQHEAESPLRIQIDGPLQI